MLIGVDVGGTKMLGFAVSAASVDASTDGTDIPVLADCRVATPTAGEALVDSLVALVRSLEQECKQKVTALAVGIAGLIDRKAVVRYSPHLADVVQLPLADRLSTALHCPVVVENDLTTATLAEAHLGAG